MSNKSNSFVVNLHEVARGEITPTTQAIIEIAAITGFTEITAKNWREFYRRSCMLSVLGIVFLKDGDMFRNPFEAEIKAHIGLKIDVPRMDARKFHSFLVNEIKAAAQNMVDGDVSRLWWEGDE